MPGSTPGVPSPILHEHPPAEQKGRLTRRNFLLGSSAAAAGLALYSSEVARHEISITTRPIALANLPEAFQNYRIAQISDIHFDEFTEPSFVERVVAHVNALEPDLVLLTGDYVSMGPFPPSFTEGAMHRCAAVLRGIVCPLRFAIMGNHDAILGPVMVGAILGAVGIPLLFNQYTPIERSGQRLWLCGTADPVTEIANLHLAVPQRPDGPVLLMCHAPDYADDVIGHPRGRLVDLMLSGHSHGGQVRLPFVGPLHLPTGALKYVEGLYRFDRMQLYVNRGIGAVGLPFRLNCPPEITLFTLQQA
jgi:predicted MPP superfamily phosphohydrolase